MFAKYVVFPILPKLKTVFLSDVRHCCTQTIPQLEEHLLKVAIIGLPNAGKSSLINVLMDRQVLSTNFVQVSFMFHVLQVCPVSRKVHTTRKRSRAILTNDNVQIIFLDTPGLTNEKEQNR